MRWKDELIGNWQLTKFTRKTKMEPKKWSFGANDVPSQIGWYFQVLRFLNIENGGCSWFCRFQSITFDCSEDSVPGVWLLKPSKKEGLDPQKLEGWRDLHGPFGFEIAMILRVGEIFENILNAQQHDKERVGSLSQQRISYDSEEIPVEKTTSDTP